MPRSLRRVGYKNMVRFRSRVPKHLGHEPRPVSIVDEQAVSPRRKRARDAAKRRSRRPLQIRPRPLIERESDEVVRSRVANVELDARIDARESDAIKRPLRIGFPER